MNDRIHVQLFKRGRKLPSGKRAKYWMLRAIIDGKPASQSLGKVEDVPAQEAKDRRSAWEGELNAGTVPLSKPGRKSLADFATEYAERRRQGDAGRGYLRGAPKLDDSTILEHDMVLRYLRHHFGDDRALDSLRLADAEAFINAMADGSLAAARKQSERVWTLGPQTIRKHIRSIKAVFNWAKRFGLVRVNPFADFDGRTRPGEPNAYVALPTFEKVLAKAPTKGWRALFALCRLAGLRLGEALALPLADHALDRQGVKRWVGVDWDKRRIHLVAEKTGVYRMVPMSPRLYDVLLESFSVLPEGAKRMVDVSPHNLTRNGKAAVYGAGVKPWPKLYQAMRSSCENDWKSGGTAEATYCCWLGHSPAVSRSHYVAPTEAEYAAVIAPAA